MIIGLTGGICCGKSAASKTFIRYGIPEVDADIVARQVVEPGTIGYNTLLKTFGKEYFLENGELDRIKLGNEVFSFPEKMTILNAIMSPLISKESDRQLKELESKHPICVYNAALICEMGNADKFRPLIVVSCPRDTQIARLMARNTLTREQAVARIDAQMPVEKKVAMANYVIDTSGTIEQSIAQTEKILGIISFSEIS
jgi:dephospho-CoA kinase